MKAVSILFIFLSTSLAFSTEDSLYDEHIAYAEERLTSEIPLTNGVILLGPETLDEYYTDGEIEKHVIAPMARIMPAEDAKNLGTFLKSLGFGVSTIYEACVYRKETKQLTVRVVGSFISLCNSQFPLLPGDVVILREPSKSELDPFK